ncbi:phospholipid-binding protein [Stappia sp. GBMRC 2046]|uniref:Phospholipid-binding protein n=1 Tax=Stappia sediminis TaxID=2692190 RepID=A0A7X3S5V9_9HYPH|nr:YbhB/YbcL family Raf kinase inhibitor-like protein [Stappia sediminis]MXN63495.1 phospholipid-binding protein [Stappia sediminis]
MGVSFSWNESHKCSSVPPAFYISGVPKGTKTLEFKMTDLDAPSFPHGGGTVPYTGTGKIPEGAFTYTGPCPPDGAHRYEFEVTAYGETGDKVLGQGKAARSFPPK